MEHCGWRGFNPKRNKVIVTADYVWEANYVFRNIPKIIIFAQSAGAVEYTDCFSAEG